jgi:hypothetical protein
VENDPILREPPLPRKVRFYLAQLICMSVLALITVLAAFRVFGEVEEIAEASNSQLSMSVHYPSRLRYAQTKQIEILIQNKTPQPLTHLEVIINPEYLRNFTEISFLPPPVQAFNIHINELRPQETYRIQVEVQAEKYGKHLGKIQIKGSGLDPIEASLESFVFP